MSYYEKYVKYKHKYHELKKEYFIQTGGNYRNGDKITFTKKGDNINGTIIKSQFIGEDKMYTVDTNTGPMYVYEKNIRRENGNNIIIEKIKPKPLAKYSDGSLVKFTDVNDYSGHDDLEKKNGSNCKKKIYKW